MKTILLHLLPICLLIWFPLEAILLESNNRFNAQYVIDEDSCKLISSYTDFEKFGYDYFGGGMGTEENPWLIQTAEHLYNIRNATGSGFFFKQVADIDLDVAPYNQGEGWVPLGHSYSFRGTYDGNGYVVSGLYINWPTGWNVGLFGQMWGGTVKNLGVTDVYINSRLYVGAIAGQINSKSTITGCYSSGEIYASQAHAGGLVGKMKRESQIINSYSTCSVSGDAQTMGGLVGESQHSSAIINSYSQGDVVSSNIEIGGLVGKLTHGGIINNSHSSANVSGLSRVGGFVGFCWLSEIHHSSANGSVIGESSNIGGFAGHNWRSTITNSHSLGNVEGQSTVGGFAGRNRESDISDSYAKGDVSCTNVDCGGFLGDIAFESLITNSYSKGTVSGYKFVGGFLGSSYGGGVIENSYSTSNVSGVANVGGFFGQLIGAHTSNSYSTGDVSGDYLIGGFGGSVYGLGLKAINCYATGGAVGQTMVGGFLGDNFEGTIINSYSCGAVAGSENIGGFVGSNYNGVYEQVFWDTITSGQIFSSAGQGLNTFDMMIEETFQNWDFIDTWKILENETYPFFTWQDSPESFNYPFTKLQLSVLPDNGGSYLGEGQYYVGETVMVVATSNEDFEFVMWTNKKGDVLSLKPMFAISMEGNSMELIAHFCDGTHYSFQSRVNTEEGGIIKVNPGDGYYSPGDTLELKALANVGYRFEGWSYEGSHEFSSCEEIVFTMPAANMVVMAEFEAMLFELNVEVAPQNAGFVLITPDSDQFVFEEEIVLNAVSNPGYEFIGWFDEENTELSTNEQMVINMPLSNLNIKAHFKAIQYELDITINPSHAGDVSIQPEKNYYFYGENVLLTAVPFTYYEFVDWRNANDDIVSTNMNYTLSIGEEDLTMKANFKLINMVQNQSGDNLVIYPNPSSSYIQINSGSHNIKNIVFYNTLGKKVLEISEPNRDLISTRSLSEGTYVIEVVFENASVRRLLQIISP